MISEDYALVLDYMAQGKSSSYKSGPLAQLIGTEFFTLFEVIPKTKIDVLEKVYIGKGEREKVEFIKRRIEYSMLTQHSVSELEKAIEKIVEDNSEKYLDFYNSSGSISVRMHQLELLPGVGKKHMKDLLDERNKQKFASFDEIAERVKLMPAPKKAIVNRILDEMRGGEKYYLFVRAPRKPRPQRRF